jgi:hypothetical protein
MYSKRRKRTGTSFLLFAVLCRCHRGGWLFGGRRGPLPERSLYLGSCLLQIRISEVDVRDVVLGCSVAVSVRFSAVTCLWTTITLTALQTNKSDVKRGLASYNQPAGAVRQLSGTALRNKIRNCNAGSLRHTLHLQIRGHTLGVRWRADQTA